MKSATGWIVAGLAGAGVGAFYLLRRAQQTQVPVQGGTSGAPASGSQSVLSTLAKLLGGIKFGGGSGGGGSGGSGGATNGTGASPGIDPSTGYSYGSPVDPAFETDPATGLTYDPSTGNYLDPQTGQVVYDAASGAYSAPGAFTAAPGSASTVDPFTGLPLDGSGGASSPMDTTGVTWVDPNIDPQSANNPFSDPVLFA